MAGASHPLTGAQAQLLNGEYPYTTEVDGTDDKLNHRVTTMDGVGVSHSTQSQRVEEIAPARHADVTESLTDSTATAIGTYYFPSSDGISMSGFNAGVGFTGKLVAPSGCTMTLTIEGTNDEDSSGDWIDVTQKFESEAGATGGASVVATNATVLFSLDKIDYPFGKVRAKLDIAGGASTSETIKMTRKAK